MGTALAEFNRKGAIKLIPDAKRFQVMRAGACNQHILFVTDGHPSSGDRTVKKQIQAAQALGVSVHTIFIGYGECPAVLDRMSVATKGARYSAQFLPGTSTVQVQERRSVL